MITALAQHPLLLLAFGIGIIAGLRSMTAPAVVAWAACLGQINLAGHRLAWMGSLAAALLLTLFAVMELIGDKLPRTPNRIVWWSLVFRACTGGLSGAAIALALHYRAILGVEPAVIGSFVGSFAGFQIRYRLTREFHLPALPVALAEDAVAIFGAIYILSRV